MKKSLLALIPALLFASCKFWNEPIEEFFSYWSAEAYVTGSDVKVPAQRDSSGVTSIASGADADILLSASNPKSFRFIMPTAGNSEMIKFTGLSAQPVPGTDYSLTQVSSDTLKLTYKSAFLKTHEWGTADLGAELTLYADDGRKFVKPYAFSIKSNTSPPKPKIAVAKTKETPAHYVLCLTVPDMDKRIAGGLIHKDITSITIGTEKYDFSLNDEQTAFVKPANDFIDYEDTEQLSEPDADTVPSGWTLYYKTDVEVKDGAAKKDYTIKLIDKEGLVSETLYASTKPNKAEAPACEIIRGKKNDALSGNGTAESTAVVIAAETEEPVVQIKLQSATSAVDVNCTVTEDGSTTSVQYKGNPVTVPLNLNGKDEKLYKVEYYADGTGYKTTDTQTVYFKVLRQHTVTFDANGGAYSDGSTTVSKTALHGTVVAAPNPLPTRDGYGVTGWYKRADGSGAAWNFATDTVTGDMTLYAQWTAGAVLYTVKHYQQNVNDDNYPAEPILTENLSGTTDASISADSIKKKYEGFKYDHIDPTTPTIVADGSTVVKVYYKRKTYTVNFNVDGTGGTISVTAVTGGSVPPGSPVTVKHGGSVTFKGRPDTGDWKVAGWTVSQGNFTSGGGTGETTATLSNVTADTTVTVKFYQSTLQNPATWRDLARAVKSAPADAVITIYDEIKATNAVGDKGIINIEEGKKLTIKGKGSSAVLNADGKSSIFDVSDILTLENITLKNGAAFSNQSGGAGVYINSKGTLIMKGSSAITDCSAVNWGGGVYVNGGTFEMQDSSTITGCSANGLSNMPSDDPAKKGGGVYVSSGTFKMKGSAIVTPSTSGDTDKPGKNDVYLEDGKTITVGSILLNAHAARITPELYKKQTVLKADSGVTLKYEVGKFTVTPDGSDTWKIDSEGKLTLYEATIKGSPSSNDAWKKLKQAVANASDGSTIFIDGEVKATRDAGNNGEIGINKNLTIKRANGASSAVIDANKGTDSKPKHRIFKVESGKTLTLENLTLKGGIAETSDMDGGGVYNKGTVEMTGGEIKNNKARNGGGIDNNGTLILTNATLTGNTATFIGGALCLSFGSSSEMTGGKIISNTCSGTSGGGVYIHAGTFKLNSSASIESNTASYGGGAYVNQNGTLIINGGSIKLNKAYWGGGVYVAAGDDNRGTLRMIKGDISDNGAGWNGTSYTGEGGGVYNGGVFEMTGGEIKDNKAGTGGGVYFTSSKGTFKMSGSAVVTPATGSEANDKGNNDVYLKTGQAITVDGSLSHAHAARITPESYTEQVVLKAGSGVTLANEVGKFAVTPDVKEEGIAQAWIIDSAGKLKKSNMEVRYDKLKHYLTTSTHAVVVNGIYRFKIIGDIPPEHLQGQYFNYPGKLAQTINTSGKKVALILPDSIPGLGGMYQCFYGCEYLVSLENIPSGVTSIKGCFHGCKNLTKAPVIPDSVNDMEHCFDGCTALTQAPTIHQGVTNMKWCFQDCKALISAPVIPQGVTDIYSCFQGCENLTQVPNIPSSVTGMGQCFKYCAALTDGPDIHSNVENMWQCFEGCANLRGLKLMCNYNDQGTYFTDVFKGCTALEDGGIKVKNTYYDNYTTDNALDKMEVPGADHDAKRRKFSKFYN